MPISTSMAAACRGWEELVVPACGWFR